MNILWIPNFCPFPADVGGKVSIAHRMLYVASKHNVYLLLEDNNISGDTKKYLNSIFKGVYYVAPLNRNKLYVAKWILTKGNNIGRYYNPNKTDKILEIVRNNDIDLINIDLPMTAVCLNEIWDVVKNIPVIINQHNIEFKTIESKLYANGVNLLTKLYALFESKKIKKFEQNLYLNGQIKCCTFVTKEDLNIFQHEFKYSPKMSLKYSPVGTDYVSENMRFQKHNNKIFVFPGAFNYPPNENGALWFIEKVFPTVKEKLPDAKVYFVGKDPSNKLMSFSSENIVVTGTVDDIKPYLRMADVFIIPIFFGGGVKMKMLETSIYGKPIISSTQGIAGTIFKKNEDVLVTDDPKEFAGYCVDVIKNPENYKDMGINLRNKAIENYIWDKVSQNYCDILESEASI